MIALGSGVTDAYQPCEATETITRRSAEILSKGWSSRRDKQLGFDAGDASGEDEPTRFPVLVMTKSDLALRDLDLWAELNRRAGFVLLVSLTSLDEAGQAEDSVPFDAARASA